MEQTKTKQEQKQETKAKPERKLRRIKDARYLPCSEKLEAGKMELPRELEQ